MKRLFCFVFGHYFTLKYLRHVKDGITLTEYASCRCQMCGKEIANAGEPLTYLIMRRRDWVHAELECTKELS